MSVIVDESQDFGNEAFRLINTLAHANEPVNTEASNRLFLVGDAHQRIYDRQVVLSHCGIQIRGRSSRLRINYRTSESILKTAVSVLKGVEFDDLDGGFDTFQGYRSLFGGPTPELIRFDSLEDAAKRVAAWVEALSRELNYQYADFCLVARTHGMRDLWEEQMSLLGVPVHCLEGREVDGQLNGEIKLATAHRVKGLEFAGIVILDADASSYPLHSVMSHAADPTDRELRLKRERALLHVAMSRARRHLMLCAEEDFSSFLAPFMKDLENGDTKP